jgi:hypothetical protein
VSNSGRRSSCSAYQTRSGRGVRSGAIRMAGRTMHLIRLLNTSIQL